MNEAEETKDNTEAKQAYKELEEAHIHHSQNLFASCCEAFDDYDKISRFLKYKDVWLVSDGQIEEFIINFQNHVKQKHKEKKKIRKFCNGKMINAQREAETQSIQKIDAYKKAHKHIMREIDKKRAEEDPQKMIRDYRPYEEKLASLIATLKGDLLDIEMALTQSLDQARQAFINTIKNLNDDIAEFQRILISEVTNEVGIFGQKLKEELNKERESFMVKIEQDYQHALEEYGYQEIETGSVLEILSGQDGNDGVDEIV